MVDTNRAEHNIEGGDGWMEMLIIIKCFWDLDEKRTKGRWERMSTHPKGEMTIVGWKVGSGRCVNEAMCKRKRGGVGPRWWSFSSHQK